jgi:hypothetical protein
MKKNLFFVAVVAAALAGCSSDESLSNVNEGTIVSDELVPVELGLSRGVVDVYQTRGTGTVGAIDKTKNDYNCEDLYVLMTDNTAEVWGFTKVGEISTGGLGVQFDGSFKSRPVYDGTTYTDADGDEQKVWAINYKHFTNEKAKYYPVDGHKSDFFAFYVDDAAVDEDGNPIDLDNDETPKILPEEPYAEEDGVVEKYVNFIIDGSQDLLAGKAEYPDGVEGGFSAKTARQGIKPRIPMKHMLTRLTFSVQPNASAKGVKIDSIKVTSASKGQLIVAYKEEGTKEPEDLIIWDEDEEVEDYNFTLGYLDGERTDGGDELDGVKNPLSYADAAADESLYEITEEDVTADGEGNIAKIPVGEALFVQPNQESYKMQIRYQYPIKGDGGADEFMTTYYNAVIKLAEGNVLEDGYSYNVNIKIYGIEEIELETTLQEWEVGEEIEIDPDAED